MTGRDQDIFTCCIVVLVVYT